MLAPTRSERENATATSRTGTVAILHLHGAKEPPLGADTWVNAKIIRSLDGDRHVRHVACVVGHPDRPTPTYTALRGEPEVAFHAIDLGADGAGMGGGRRAVVDAWSFGRSLARMVRLVRRHRIDVIHTSDRPRDAVAAVLVARCTRALAMVHVHVGFASWTPKPLRWALRRADALIAVSDFVGRTLTENGHDPRRVHTLLNAIDADAWTAGDGAIVRAEFGLPGDAPVILTVCRLFEAKGPGELIRALPALAARHDGVRLFIVGGDMQAGYREELQALAAGLGVADRVFLPGRRSDVANFMAAATIYAMPSRFEPFGLVYAEAMAAGLPVVALDNGGTPEVVEHGVTGLLSPMDDLDALTANLDRLLADGGLRARMGEAGRRRVFERFTLQRQAAAMADLYRRVLSDEPRTTRRSRS